MLRKALLIIALLMTSIGFFCVLSGRSGALPILIWGVILLASVLFERWRYQPIDSGHDDWQETDEQFIDPETGKLTRVLYQTKTGERRYVQVDDSSKHR
ncbi:hypothetical protein [Solimicrobium silvestre]|uniref:Uncharacterized protein n=1 Tax=Solimicrobium silvestre TaxID=2099400 RepID=A0A2S9H3I4_9BURK|nr:hypothetical protein [Solimicrobium silvestre]PRC94544.1 hypothetical protein S2091_0547 [Solimicrobium silvestre]